MAIKNYSTTASSNTTINGINIAENCPAANLNDGMRNTLADMRTWYEDAQWIDLGHTPVYASASSFTFTGVDYTSTYTVGRRIKLVAPTPSTIYGTIVTSSFSTNTTITVDWDGTTLTNETLTSVAVAALTQANPSFTEGLQWTLASATTTSIGGQNGMYGQITGTTTITSLGSGRKSAYRIVQFAGALTLTHNGSSLILPSGANITTAVGDVAEFVSLGSSNWRCTNYMRASGSPIVPTTVTSYTAKTTLVDADQIAIADSAASNANAKITVANLKTTLAATTSAVGMVELATTAETLAGTDTTRALTAAGLAGTKSLAADGYFSLPSGLTMQWGDATHSASTSGTETAITFPVAFSTACVNVVCSMTATSAGGSPITIPKDGTLTTSGFTARVENNGNASSATKFFWQAYGY